MADAAAEYGQLAVAVEHVQHRDAHPGGQCQFTLRITIPGGSRTQAKLEISMDEPVLLEPGNQPLLHGYPPEPETVGSIRCYSINEIACEKLRAYLQSGQHLADRGWVAGRSRDTFDLAVLHEDGLISPATIAGILRQKCAVRSVGF